MKSELKASFAILCCVPFIMVLGNSMLIPILPKIKAAMDLSFLQVGLIITAFSIPAGVVIPISGFLSDRYGRRIIMAPSLIIYGLGGLGSGLAALLLPNPFPLLLAGRVVQGIGAGGTYQLAMALTGDIFKSRERTKTLGILESSNGLGKVVSPIAGAALGLISWVAPFFIYSILALPVAGAIWLFIKEPSKNQQHKPSFSEYKKQVIQIFQEKGVSLLACFIAGMLVLLILFGFLSYLSDFLEAQYNISGMRLGLLIAIPVGALTLTSYLSGNLLQKNSTISLKTVVISGLLAVTLSLAVVTVSRNIYIIFVAMTILGIGTGLVLPSINTLITSAAPTSERGIITCLYGSMRFFGVAIGPPAFGALTRFKEFPAFLVVTLFTLAITVIILSTLREKSLLPSQLLQKGTQN